MLSILWVALDKPLKHDPSLIKHATLNAITTPRCQVRLYGIIILLNILLNSQYSGAFFFFLMIGLIYEPTGVSLDHVSNSLILIFSEID